MNVGSLLAGLMLTVMSSLFLMAIVTAVWLFDRYDREPLPLVAAVLTWGAIPAPFLALVIESGIAAFLGLHFGGLQLQWLQSTLVAPAVEEILKGAAILAVILFSDQFDNPTDGVVYGTAVGLGFAVSENLFYELGAVVSSPHNATSLVILRTLTSAGVHAVSSSVLGGALGIAYLSRRRVARWTAACTGLLGGILIHAGWNGAVGRMALFDQKGPFVAAVSALPAVYALYIGVLAMFLQWEHRLLVRELSEEVRLGVLPEWVAEVIPSYRRRIRSDCWPSRRERTVIARLITRLAFRKHAIAHLPKEEARLAGLEVVRLRERAQRILMRGAEESDDDEG